MNDTSTGTVIALPEAQVSIIDAYLRGLPSAGTRRVYGDAIEAFDVFLGDRSLTSASRRDVEAYRAHLEQAGRAPATVAKVLSALSGFFEFSVVEGVLDRNPVASARRPKVSDTSPRRALAVAEVQALLAVPNVNTLVGLRDKALITVLAVQGWRVAEVLDLEVEHLDEEQGHRVAQITGKGAKVARVPLAAVTWAAISKWTTAAGVTAGPVFVPVLKGGRVQLGAAMSAQSAWKRVRHLARKAGLKREVHPHLFRHAAVTMALANGVPLHSVQDFARHADPRTTRRYDSHRNSLNNPAPHVVAGVLVGDDRSV